MPQRRGANTELSADGPRTSTCCVPGDCLLPDQPIRLEELSDDVVKVVCNDDHCTQGQFMHQACFDSWEQQVLNFLRTCGRARSWSAKQRLQNLWTKKGYDLAFKACGCRCGRGHLKKDLDWTPPQPAAPQVVKEEARTKKKRQRQKQKPALAAAGRPAEAEDAKQRNRAGSASSTCSSGSPPSADSPISGPKRPSKVQQLDTPTRTPSGKGLFARRQDFSSFNILPRHKVNSYHIKVDDEEHHGVDDVRTLILATLSSANRGRVCCLVCEGQMAVYDRYPLLDGTFFLSPRQHAEHNCFKVYFDGRIQFLYAVCMGCLEGWRARIECRACRRPWDGSSLVLGTMYFYDIFAATPCCGDRVKCNTCTRPLMQQQDRLNFFSDYSHPLACTRCSSVDTHFVKPLFSTFYRTLYPEDKTKSSERP
ncbi:headcase protein [Neocloeon triangulifer]|uniref:headcase protein n=1 Tax=Neocloeon triangulifer TaxID=2078957 RepID=UPI00286F9155|nr:headcase protein [Neocloeon triangulifer]